MLRLLSPAERARLVSTDSLSKTFNKIGALYYNPYTEPAWRAAVTSYQKTMEPAEDAVAAKLRVKLGDASGKVRHAAGKIVLRSFCLTSKMIRLISFFVCLVALKLAVYTRCVGCGRKVCTAGKVLNEGHSEQIHSVSLY